MKLLPIRFALVVLLVSTVVLFASTARPAAGAPVSSPPRKADARQLLALAEQGLSGAVRAACAAQGRLDPSLVSQRPFWAALDKMGAALRQVRSALPVRGEGFFRALEGGSADLGELRVVWARTGVPDPGVSEGLRVLSASWQLLRSGYGREAVRTRQGGGLTEAERQSFLRIQRLQERFAQSLAALEERSRRRGDEAMLAELRRMADEAARIAAAQASLNAYLNALMIADAQRGEWTGNTAYADPEDRSEWLDAGAVVEELYVEEDVGQVFTLDLGDLSRQVDLPEELASAVQVYTPAEEAAPGWDPVEEEEALAEEEMDETGMADSDVALYADEVEEEGEVEEAAEETGETAEVTEAVEAPQAGPAETPAPPADGAKGSKPSAPADPEPDPEKPPKPPGLG